MKPTILKHGTIYQSDHVFGYAGWPTLTKLKDGTLVCVYSGDRLAHVCPFGRVLMSKSFNGGESWSAPMTVMNTALDDRDGGIAVFGENRDKVIVTSFTNTIKMQIEYATTPDHPHHQYAGQEPNPGLTVAYFDKMEKAGVAEIREKEALGSTYVISFDNCNSFTDFTLLPITAPHGPCVLNDGSLFYVGRNFSSEKGEDAIYGKYHALKKGIYYMTGKDGKTWTDAVEIPMVFTEQQKEWMFCEPYALQLSSGRILVHIRVHKFENGEQIGCGIYQCHSDNMGESWTQPKQIVDVGFPSHLTQLKNGWIICSYAIRFGEQKGERVIVSKDDGETWSEEFILRDDGVDGDLGYPSTVELDDGALLTAYYHKLQGRTKPGIYYTKWKLEY
ncbi:MAG: exo-alpha-sialidase [Ruminococcaceae bacterium]|nr:exo-alpha-sialidase [Oscillospiraceae bacterium]